MAYNTVPFHGKACLVEWEGTAIGYSKGWNISVSLDMADASRAGQSWKEALPGQAGWNGSFEMWFVAGNAQQKLVLDNLIIAAPGTKISASKFLLDVDTNAFTGAFFVTGISVSAAMGGVVSATVNFQGDGALALTNAA
jgi:predicted secreted protein